jgi:protein SCO1/2
VRVGVAALALALLVPLARADDARPPILRDVGIDQRLDAALPRDLAFRDEEGRPVRLGDYLAERPVILAPVYYGCPMLCGQLLNGLVSALMAVPFTVGRDVTVVAVSFDPSEGPALAAEKKALYVRRYGRPGTDAGWHFLTGDADAIARLTAAIGFRYTYDAAQQQYAHAAAIVVLTPGGHVSRYLFGVEPAPRDLRLALVEASEGRIGSVVDQLLLFCFHWDPATGRYSAVVMRLVRIGGALTVLALVGLVALMARRDAMRGAA